MDESSKFPKKKLEVLEIQILNLQDGYKNEYFQVQIINCV